MEDTDTTSNLRRQDFRTGVLLILLALGIIWEASSYPMTDSYGGVQNVWYVSPALLPIIVGVLLLLLALVLTGNALAYHGWPAVLTGKAAASKDSRQANRRFLVIVVFIATFVYAFIPVVDFYIASAFFLFAFSSAFYLDKPSVLLANALVYSAVGAAVGLMGAAAIAGPQWLLDVVTAAGLLVLLLLGRRICGRQADCRRHLRITLLVSLLVPLVLCPLFKFGLLVPLPTEGVFIELMEQARYGLRAMIG